MPLPAEAYANLSGLAFSWATRSFTSFTGKFVVATNSVGDVPTLKEAGVDGVDVTQWYGFFAPAKTPKPVIEKLNAALNQVLKDKEIEKRIEDHGADVETSTPEQLGSLVKSELVKWKSVVQRAKLTAD